MWVQIYYNGKSPVTRKVSGMDFVDRVRWFAIKNQYDIIIVVPGEK